MKNIIPVLLVYFYFTSNISNAQQLAVNPNKKLQKDSIVNSPVIARTPDPV